MTTILAGDCCVCANDELMVHDMERCIKHVRTAKRNQQGRCLLETSSDRHWPRLRGQDSH